MLHRFVIVLCVLVVTGCATPYQRFDLFGRGGYEEKNIAEATYEVSYYGNQATSMETLYTLLLYRSAEVTLNNGYDYFEVFDSFRHRPFQPFRSLSGFYVARHSIKMYSGQPTKDAPDVYVAQKVISEFGPHISKQK